MTQLQLCDEKLLRLAGTGRLAAACYPENEMDAARQGLAREPLSRTRAILHLLCPRCRKGHVFRGAITMNERCSVCGLKFEREQGYFLGAMYISYPLGTVILICLAIPFWLWTSLGYYWVLLMAGILLLPFVPIIFRYSRVIWLHIDHAIDPEV